MSNTGKNPQNERAAVIIIGNEILSGRTQDLNTPWIAQNLMEHGIVLGEVRVVPDEEEAIMRAVNELRTSFRYVFTTGGIGPTHDDITAASIAKAFGVAIGPHDEAFRMLEKHYGTGDINAARAKMAHIPVGATLIPNPVSGAPGFIMENVYVMAGVPRIMQAMFNHILKTIEGGAPILSSTVSSSLPESAVAQQLEELQNRYPDIQIGSYPHYRSGALGLNLVLRGTDPKRLEQATIELIDLIRSLGDEPQALSVGTE